MKPYCFSIRGDPNIRATHRTTLEFTCDKELTPAGDCIVGVSADFLPLKLAQFKSCPSIRILINANRISETIIATPNQEFNDEGEMVIRLGTHKSSRTFANGADKAATHISRKLISLLQNPNCVAEVEVRCNERS